MGAQLTRLGLSMSGRHGKRRVVCPSLYRAGTATASHRNRLHPSGTLWREYSSSRNRCAQCRDGENAFLRVSQMLAELKDLVDKKLFSQVSSKLPSAYTNGLERMSRARRERYSKSERCSRRRLCGVWQENLIFCGTSLTRWGLSSCGKSVQND
jgi:hypothetical protein